MKNKAASPRQERQYIRTRARKLPIYKCYVSTDWEATREASVIVIRKHNQGTFTIGFYLIDLFARGCWETFYRFNVDQEEMDQMIDFFQERSPIKETDYNFAHNMIYGAVEYAQECGIDPAKDFEDVTEYLLEEDTDEIPIIEFEYGRNGRPFLMVEDRRQASMYLPQMEKALGPGAFDVCIGDGGATEAETDDFEFSDDLKNQGIHMFNKYMETKFDISSLTPEQQLLFHAIMKIHLEKLNDLKSISEGFFTDYLATPIDSDNLQKLGADFAEDGLALNVSLLNVCQDDPDASTTASFSIFLFSTVFRTIRDKIKKLSPEETKEQFSSEEKAAALAKGISRLITSRLTKINKEMDAINDAINQSINPEE